MAKHFYKRDGLKFAHPEVYAIREAVTANSMYDLCMFYANPENMKNVKVDEDNSAIKAGTLQCGERTERTRKLTVRSLPEFENPTDITVEVAYPTGFEGGTKKLPCIFTIPGGGLGGAIPPDIEGMADRFKAVVVSTIYRGFNEGGYPYTVDDLHSVYAYVVKHAKELNANSDKIVIEGLSSGGQLSLALCHRLKRYGFAPRGCIVRVPIVDERLIYPSSHYESNGWDNRLIHWSSNLWLHNMPTNQVPAEAFANHAEYEDCIGLPPTVIYTSECDPCVDPCLQYTSKLLQAGVYVNLRVWSGVGHGDLAGDNDYIKFYEDTYQRDIDNLIEYDLRRPWTVTEAGD